MPIVDLAPSPIGEPLDRTKAFAVTPGEIDIEKGSDAPERPTWAATFGAAFRQDNTIGAYFSSEDRNAPTHREDGFNPWDAIKGTKYEQNWNSFVDVHNSRAVEARKAQIDREKDDRRLLGAAPWWQSFPAQLVAGTLDWPTLLPGGAFVRGAKGGVSIARSALATGAAAGISTAAQEAALQSIETTRPGAESATNIGASVLLGGLLGAGGSALLNKVEWQDGVRALERELAGEAPPPREIPDGFAFPSPAGAAANLPADLAGNAIAGRAASVVAAATSRLNPLLRGLHSPSPVTREVLTNMVENSVYLKKNFEGVASEPAAETLMKEWNGGLARALTATDDAFAEHRKAGGQLTRLEFREAVGKAMRRGDEADDPRVANVAKEWRAKVFDPLKEAAINARLLPEDVSVDTAASYFSRMWNRNKLIAREGDFKNIVTAWIERQMPRWVDAFDQETIAGATKLDGDRLKEFEIERRVKREEMFGGSTREFATGIADDVFNTLTGKTVDNLRPEFVKIKARGPLKERTFNIPDELVEDFLEHDVDLVGRRYTRIMGADVELANKFGSPDMTSQIERIRTDYAKLRHEAGSEKDRLRINESEKSDIRDIEGLRDLMRGTGSRFSHPFERNFDAITRGFNHFNYLRSMGEVSLASLTETARPAMVHGLMPYIGTVGKLAANLNGVKLSVKEAQLAGNVAERVLGHRLATIAEILDPYSSRGPVEAFLENMTNIASKWNGIRLLTDMQKSIAAVMTQNRIIVNAGKFASIKDSERAYMAHLGINQGMAERIAKQFETHGEIVDGVKVANSEAWTDGGARRTYRAAINKDVDSIITTKGVADVPLFASTPAGRAVLQFKSFFLASHQRVMLRGLQEDQARFVGGVISMTAIGMLATWLKAISGNREEKLADFGSNPGWWVGEGLDKSGIFAVPMEIANIAEKSTGYNLIKSPLKVFDEGSRLSQRIQNRSMAGSIFGPSAGTIDDFSTVVGIPRRMIEGEDVTQAQKNAAERLMPFNSYFGMRQMLRYVVNTPN